jgi:hypothetical protein
MLNGFSEEEYISFFEQHEDFLEFDKLEWKITM